MALRVASKITTTQKTQNQFKVHPFFFNLKLGHSQCLLGINGGSFFGEGLPSLPSLSELCLELE